MREKTGRVGANSVVKAMLEVELIDGLPIVSAGDTIAALTGYRPDDFVHGRVHLLAAIHADDRGLVEALLAGAGDPPADARILRFRHADGRIRCLAARCRKSGDGLRRLREIELSDPGHLTAARATPGAGRNFRALLDNSDDGLYFKDGQHLFTCANQRFAALAGGVADWRELLGKSDYDFFSEAEADRGYAAERQILAGGPPVRDLRQRVSGHAGTRWIESRLYPIRNAAGEVVGVAGIERDLTDFKAAGTALTSSEERYQRIVANLAPAYFFYANDRNGVFTFVSSSVTAMLGWQPEEFLTHYSQVVSEHPVNQAIEAANAAAFTGVRQPTSLVVGRHKDGSERWIEIDEFPLFDEQGKVVALEGIAHDITRRRQVEARLELAASVFTSAAEGIMITDARGTIIEVNDSFTRITGYPADAVIGTHARRFSSVRHPPAFYAELWRAVITNGHWRGELWSQRLDGEVYLAALTISGVRNADGRIHHCVALFSDVTAEKAHQRELESSAYHDALTSLPNRALLADRLQHAIAQAQRRGHALAVVYVDLDGFKAINDHYGHAAGDQLLITVGRRMQQSLREGDTLARLGGDEFVAVLVDLADGAAGVSLLQRLLAAAAQPLRIGDLVLQVSASLGVTFYRPAENLAAEQLLRQADQAMYQAKLTGKNRYHVFDAELDRNVRGQHETLTRIRSALANDEFVLHYQPKINLCSGALIGVEALLRWQHPQQGLLLPASFLRLIEEHPLIVEVGEWTIATALGEMAKWQAAGLKVPVSVNISARQLQQADFVDRLRLLLAAHPDLDHGCLEIEIVESSALEDLLLVSQVIEVCRELGVTFALDDFGSGYSSLTYLKRLPVSVLKIDQSFVGELFDDPGDLAMIKGILGLAGAFQRLVIAEGVETHEQGRLLRQLGCELGQGFGIARPMPAAALPAWAAAWQRDASWLSPLRYDDAALLRASV